MPGWCEWTKPLLLQSRIIVGSNPTPGTILKGKKMTTRAKFTVTEVTHHESGGTKIVLEPRYSKAIPEDQTFCKYTPGGRFEMWVTNPDVIERFKPGRVFYADFTEAPEGTSKSHE